MDSVDHLDSIPFVPCINLKDDWFVSYKSLAKKEKYINMCQTFRKCTNLRLYLVSLN